MHNGAGASQKVTQAIEREIVKLQRKEWLRKPRMESGWQCRTFDPKEAYFKQIRSLIDFKKIKRAKMKVAVECMYGTGRGYLDALLEEAGAAVTLFRDTLNPSFGGHHPEPNAEGMAEARACVLRGKAQLGLGLDGDADRFGIVDKDGTWLTPNQILALALYHLAKNRKWKGAVVRTTPPVIRWTMSRPCLASRFTRPLRGSSTSEP